MQRTYPLDAPKSPQPFFEREESSSGNLEGRKIEHVSKENLNNKTNDHVIFLLSLIVELGNLLKDVIERQEKESEEIKSKFAESSLEIVKLQIKSNTLYSELETIVDILKGFNRQISHLENCADLFSIFMACEVLEKAFIRDSVLAEEYFRKPSFEPF